MADKTWGDEPFWGLGYDWDPDWFLTERQKELRAKLIELCETGDAREREALGRRAAVSRGATSRSSPRTASWR